MLRELSLEVFEPGVAGVPVPCREDSGFRNLFIPSRSPKLLRPVEVEVRAYGGASRSSRDSRPRELIVDDLPLICGLVGDGVPLFLESGLNKAVAGDAFGFCSSALPGVDPGGVAVPFLTAELRVTDFCLGDSPEAVEDVLWRTGLEGVSEGFEAAFWS